MGSNLGGFSVGNQLGRVLEVEKWRNNKSQNFFMRVKVAIPLEKEIRRGAFLAWSDGRKHWVNFNYERLPIFCNYCGLLGHDIRYYAKYFSKRKTGTDVECGYGDWLKVMGGRARSPQGRGFGKDNNRDIVHEAREDTRGSQSMAMVEESSGDEESN